MSNRESCSDAHGELADELKNTAPVIRTVFKTSDRASTLHAPLVSSGGSFRSFTAAFAAGLSSISDVRSFHTAGRSVDQQIAGCSLIAVARRGLNGAEKITRGFRVLRNSLLICRSRGLGISARRIWRCSPGQPITGDVPHISPDLGAESRTKNPASRC